MEQEGVIDTVLVPLSVSFFCFLPLPLEGALLSLGAAWWFAGAADSTSTCGSSTEEAKEWVPLLLLIICTNRHGQAAAGLFVTVTVHLKRLILPLRIFLHFNGIQEQNRSGLTRLSLLLLGRVLLLATGGGGRHAGL